MRINFAGIWKFLGNFWLVSFIILLALYYVELMAICYLFIYSRFPDNRRKVIIFFFTSHVTKTAWERTRIKLAFYSILTFDNLPLLKILKINASPLTFAQVATARQCLRAHIRQRCLEIYFLRTTRHERYFANPRGTAAEYASIISQQHSWMFQLYNYYKQFIACLLYPIISYISLLDD